MVRLPPRDLQIYVLIILSGDCRSAEENVLVHDLVFVSRKWFGQLAPKFGTPTSHLTQTHTLALRKPLYTTYGSRALCWTLAAFSVS
jgi:hypothetical protein